MRRPILTYGEARRLRREHDIRQIELAERIGTLRGMERNQGTVSMRETYDADEEAPADWVQALRELIAEREAT